VDEADLLLKLVQYYKSQNQIVNDPSGTLKAQSGMPLIVNPRATLAPQQILE